MALYEIPLTRNRTALVDREDYDTINKHKWYCSTLGYAVRNYIKRNGSRGILYMHREILGVLDGRSVDHINHNTLDNRKGNLRFANKSKNGMNRQINSNNTTGYKGVTFRKDTGKYRAHITKDGKRNWLGQYRTIEEAARAYNEKAIELFGEFTKLNIIDK